MVAAQMGTEQGGASAWRADSNLCMHVAIEVNGGNCVLRLEHSRVRVGLVAGWARSVQSPRQLCTSAV